MDSLDMVADNCRRIRNKSNGAVQSRAPAPATPPATPLCHCGYIFFGGGSSSCCVCVV